MAADEDYEKVAIKQDPMTPVEIELALSQLFNAVAKNQVMLMALRTSEVEAKLEFEKAHLRATASPSCPKVERGGVTVAERDDWIRRLEFEEYSAYETAKKKVKNCREYMEMLNQQCSLVQSMNRSVVASYWGAPDRAGRQ